jgi:hypothetical protein
MSPLFISNGLSVGTACDGCINLKRKVKSKRVRSIHRIRIPLIRE